jgi:hypothetical protein
MYEVLCSNFIDFNAIKKDGATICEDSFAPHTNTTSGSPIVAE